MKFNFQHAAVAVALIGSLVAPLPLRAAAAPPAYSQTQKDAALSQVSRALKSAGSPGVQTATLKQLAPAIATVVSSGKVKRSFIGALAYALIQARPELTIPIAKMLLEDLTRPGDCPLPEYTYEITRAVIAANPTAASDVVRELIEEYPCRAALITGAAVEVVPGSSKAIVAAAFGAAPLGARVAILDAAKQAGGVTGQPINPALVHTPDVSGSSNNSAATRRT